MALAIIVGCWAGVACSATKVPVGPLRHSATGPALSSPASSANTSPSVMGTPLEDELDEEVLEDELDAPTLPELALVLDDVELLELDEEARPLELDDVLDAPLEELLATAPLELEPVGGGLLSPDFLSPESLQACNRRLQQSTPIRNKVPLDCRSNIGISSVVSACRAWLFRLINKFRP
jgi:hypothetical protein